MLRRGRRRPRLRRAHRRPDDARARRGRRRGRRPLPLLRARHVGARADAGGGAGHACRRACGSCTSGTLGLALEPIATALEAVVERLADSALIAVDPNCRPVGGRRPRRLPGAHAARALRTATCSRSARRTSSYLEPDLPAVEGVRALLEHGPTRRAAHARAERRAGGHAHRRGRRAGSARQGGRHDRRRRCVRRRLPGLVERARARPRRARPRSTSWSRRRVRLPGRRAHVLAAGRVAAVPARALRLRRDELRL